MLETSLAIIAVCLPTLQPIGRSPTLQRMVRSARSVISIRSRSSESRIEQNLSGTTAGSRRHGSNKADIPLDELNGRPFDKSVASTISQGTLGGMMEGNAPQTGIMVMKTVDTWSDSGSAKNDSQSQ